MRTPGRSTARCSLLVRPNARRHATRTAVARRETVVVADVHEFPGHIACDAASNSEIVVPLLRGSEVLGVLDVDSPAFDRFDGDDREGFEAVAAIYVDSLR